MAIQHLRSSTASKRPLPGSMSDGQVAINTNTASPGIFFKDSAGALIKIGPTHIGATAPNASPAAGGATGNTVGEQWLDTTGGTYVLKIWDGSAWRSETGTFVDVNGDTMTGTLVMDNQQQVRFRETTANGTNYIAIQAPASVAADRTLTLPDVSGTIVSTGDTGTVTSTMIADGTIVDADISASAEIAVSKLADGTARQLLQTDAAGTGVEWASNIDIPGTLDVTSAATFDSSVAVTGALTKSGSNVVTVGDTGTVTSTMIADGTIVNADVNASAAIAGTKISPDFGSQNRTSTGTSTAASFIPTSSTAPTNGLYLSAANSVALSSNGTERLRITSAGQLSHIGAGSSGSPAVSFNGSAASNSLVVDSNSRVGVGTSAPSTKLAIADTTNQLSVTTGTQELIVRANSTEAGLYTFQSIPLTFYNNNQERLRITSTGLVGIGTSSPEAGHLLQVNGIIASVTSFGGFTALQAAGGAGFRWTLNNDSTFRLQRTANGFSSSTTPILIDSSDRVGIGTVSPSSTLTVGGNPPAAGAIAAVGSSGGIALALSDNANSSLYVRTASGGAIIGTDAGGTIRFATSGNDTANEKARIDNSGRLLIGTSSSINTVVQAGLQLQSSGANAYLSVGRWDNNAANPGLVFNKSRGASPGTRAVVQADDSLGQIAFAGDDGSAFVIGAEIKAVVDGTPGVNDMPGRLIFSTTSDGAASPTERLRITSAGVLQVADAGNIAVGTTTGTKIGTATTQKLGFFNKTPVVQPAAVADATDAASVITQLNALLARMRDLGLIAT